MPDLDLGKVLGSKLHNVTAAPAASLGLEDDWALNTSNGDVYQKTASGWIKQGNFKGPTGAMGAKGSTGNTGPQGPAGTDGKTPTLSINASGHLIATYE